MPKEYEPRIFKQLRVDMKIGSVLGPAYRQLPQERVWMSTGDAPVITALDLSQESQYAKDKFYVTYRAFIGTDPPEDLLAWHLGVRLESVPSILTATKQHIDGLPRHLEEWGDPNKIEKDAEKIAQAGVLVFGHMRTPEGIVALVESMGNLRPTAPRLLGITVSGQQIFGITIR